VTLEEYSIHVVTAASDQMLTPCS